LIRELAIVTFSALGIPPFAEACAQQREGERVATGADEHARYVDETDYDDYERGCYKVTEPSLVMYTDHNFPFSHNKTASTYLPT